MSGYRAIVYASLRRLRYAPIAMFTVGCVADAWQPAVRASQWAENVPPPTPVTLPARGDAIAAWLLPQTNVWARYEKFTLLTSLEWSATSADLPDPAHIDIVRRAQIAAQRTAECGLPPDTMWVVDLRGAASVAFGAVVSQHGNTAVSLIPTFNNWPAEDELVPAEETLAAMISMRPRLPPADAPSTRPMFLLDSWRLAFRDEAPPDSVTDNRYILYPSDLPDPQVLAQQGIRRMVYVVESLDENETEEDDLHDVFTAYQNAGVTLYMVDLNWLSSQTCGQDFNVRIESYSSTYYSALWHRVLFVRPREVCVHDPAFYARARGGFGGVHGAPSPFRPGSHPGMASVVHSFGGYGGFGGG